MKKVAVTVAVLALGLAACNKQEAGNNAANETAVENNAEYDVNAASNDAAASADNALNAASNDINAAGNAVENAGNTVENATENATTNH
jgi:predicted small secreted protein